MMKQVTEQHDQQFLIARIIDAPFQLSQHRFGVLILAKPRRRGERCGIADEEQAGKIAISHDDALRIPGAGRR